MYTIPTIKEQIKYFDKLKPQLNLKNIFAESKRISYYLMQGRSTIDNWGRCVC